MTIATNVTWASAIKHHPDFQKSTENLGSFASIINNPSFDAATCLHNLGNKPDPIMIFPSAVNQRPLAIHNIKEGPWQHQDQPRSHPLRDCWLRL